MKKLKILAILLFVYGNLLNLAAQSKLLYAFKGGLNFSQFVALPDEMSSVGSSYQMNYKPGYNFASEFIYQYKTIKISLGLGYKHFRFDLQRSSNNPTTWPVKYSLSEIRLFYLDIPFNIYWNIGHENELFVMMGSKISWLVNDLSNVTFENRDSKKYSRETIKPNTIFLSLGLGMYIYQNISLMMELGLTPANIDQKVAIGEGDYYYKYFHYSKKILCLSIMFCYELPIIN